VAQHSDIPFGYPGHRAVDVGLRDGSTIRIRPVRLDDLHDVVELFGRLSDRSSEMRFHGRRRLSADEVRQFVAVDYRGTFGLVALSYSGDEPRIVSLASYIETVPGHAEIGIAVDDPFQGRGLGSILIEHLSEAAAEAGIAVFEAEILGGNTDMLEVVRALQLPMETSVSGGVVHVEFPTSPTEAALDAFEQREAIAAAAGVARLVRPSSIAVIGASRRRGTIGGELFRNLLDFGFEGPVYPVNPTTQVVQSVPAYPAILDVPGPVDLAVIVVPAAQVLHIATQCAEKGVKGLLVISAGFSEVGAEGRARQDELLAIAREHGMRIIGPNCMGLINTDPDFRLNASFTPVVPLEGRLAFSSQSGALGIAVIDRARSLGLGMSSFVSVGNKADISGNDLLQFWEQDPNTDVILLYLESFGNPRKFARIARRVSHAKPVVAVKSGRSAAGARAAASHTASVVAGDVAVEALFRQAGVIRTDTLEELFDVAALLAHQPLPAGDNVAILTNAGGLGILCADACESAGLNVVELKDETVAALRTFLPAEASVANPVDMIASATAEQYGRALDILLADPRVDAVIVIFIPPLVTRAEEVADALTDVVTRGDGKPVLSCFLGVQGIHQRLRRDECTIPSYAFPESAARALGKTARYERWRRGPQGAVPHFDGIEGGEALNLAVELLEGGARWLDPDAVARLLDHYGIRSAGARLASDPEEVAKATAEIGSPVAVKIVSRSITHKTDVGGVELGLQSPEAAADAARAMVRRLSETGLADQLDGFLVQEMVAPEGAEMFVGMTQDPLFGPILACGAGGTMVELIRDVAVRITPLTDLDAHEMLRSLKTWPLFEGYRGQPALDAAGLEDLLLRLSAMVEDLPQIVELDLNPVLVSEAGRGCMVLDARVRVATPQPARPRGARTT
jgi:acetyl coenzyme A synthetase (ADP forming)-like protein